LKPEAKRLQSLPPYLFARIEKQVADARAQGVDVISLGIGDPDRPKMLRHILRDTIKPSTAEPWPLDIWKSMARR